MNRSKPGPKGPRILISKDRYEHRLRLLRYLSATRNQLFRAYVDGNERRIAVAKLRLARLLKEIADSPELGPTFPFKWGSKLEILLERDFDPELGTEDSGTTDWYQLANKLESQAQDVLLEAAS